MARARILRLSPREAVMTAKALLLYALVEVGVRVVPLPRLTGWLGMELGAPEPAVAPPAWKTLGDLGVTEYWAVHRVARRWPFARGQCLRESLVLGWLYRRHGVVLHIGVRRDSGAIKAHAWISAGGRPVGFDAAHVPFEFRQDPPRS